MLDMLHHYTPWIAGIFVVFNIFFEIAPIKFNPISGLLKWMGVKLNQNVMTEIKEIDQHMTEFEREIGNIKNKMDKNRIEDLRFAIIDFSDSMRTGRKHSKNAFEHVMKYHDEYITLLKKYGLANGVTNEAYKYICEVYQQCLKENKFI